MAKPKKTRAERRLSKIEADKAIDRLFNGICWCVLKNRKPVPITANTIRGLYRKIKPSTKIRRTYFDNCVVCTSFMAIDHDYLFDGSRVHFETMVFFDPSLDVSHKLDGEPFRSTNHRDALKQHWKIVREIEKSTGNKRHK
ncbi:hypothetical protein J7384_17235 [Endozoicomonas sp. G2_1]|uniref:hypothetical protein n=1 Tax=Endozoicomonas sp. G2_1 TaxID=2821091 RepID=UPI001ADD3575|nr:hypothetical protein [Endozoicomonas sp. G2_1]MBO9492109.1 hypothetical protein [Endozoicomonas sp. G2_1]